jgi:hypothetical protein
MDLSYERFFFHNSSSFKYIHFNYTFFLQLGYPQFHPRTLPAWWRSSKATTPNYSHVVIMSIFVTMVGTGDNGDGFILDDQHYDIVCHDHQPGQAFHGHRPGDGAGPLHKRDNAS